MTLNRIPQDNLGYAVLLNLDYGTSFGSGFRLRYKGLNFIVTAKHVLYNKENVLRCKHLQAKCQCVDLDTGKMYPVDMEMEITELKSSFHPILDIAVIYLGRNLTLFPENESLKTDQRKHKRPGILIFEKGININEDLNLPMISVDYDATRPYKDVRIGNETYILGYPMSLGISEIPQIDFTKPLLRKGIIAGLNESLKTIILDSPVYFGNSGGPVIEHGEDDYYRVIGVVSQYIPFVNKWVNSRENYSNVEYLNSGYSVVSPMDGVHELIEDKFNVELEKNYDQLYIEYKDVLDKLRKERSE